MLCLVMLQMGLLHSQGQTIQSHCMNNSSETGNYPPLWIEGVWGMGLQGKSGLKTAVAHGTAMRLQARKVMPWMRGIFFHWIISLSPFLGWSMFAEPVLICHQLGIMCINHNILLIIEMSIWHSLYLNPDHLNYTMIAIWHNQSFQ